MVTSRPGRVGVNDLWENMLDSWPAEADQQIPTPAPP